MLIQTQVLQLLDETAYVSEPYDLQFVLKQYKNKCIIEKGMS